MHTRNRLQTSAYRRDRFKRSLDLCSRNAQRRSHSCCRTGVTHIVQAHQRQSNFDPRASEYAVENQSPALSASNVCGVNIGAFAKTKTEYLDVIDQRHPVVVEIVIGIQNSNPWSSLAL